MYMYCSTVIHPFAEMIREVFRDDGMRSTAGTGPILPAASGSLGFFSKPS